MHILSVNVGRPRPSDFTDAEATGIDKLPVAGPVAVAAPGPKGSGGSALAGDAVCDLRHHGGNDQAVYVFAREDLNAWEVELGCQLSEGVFGENLTTLGLDVNGALIGEHWKIGPDLVLEVTSARIPCRTFAGWLGEREALPTRAGEGWLRRFTRAAAPGAYLRVLEPGEVRSGDRVEIVHRPEHKVTVSFLFRALTLEPELLPHVLAAGEALHPKARATALKRVGPAGRPALRC